MASGSVNAMTKAGNKLKRESSKAQALANLPTEIGKKAGLFGKLQPGVARKRINAT